MEYLLDTNICIYFLKGRYGLVDKIDGIGFENLFISKNPSFIEISALILMNETENQ